MCLWTSEQRNRGARSRGTDEGHSDAVGGFSEATGGEAGRTWCLVGALKPKDYLLFTLLLKQRWTSMGGAQMVFVLKFILLNFVPVFFFLNLKNRLKL